MTDLATDRPRQPSRAGPRRWLQRAILVLLLLAAVPMGLTVAYGVGEPASTLMLWRQWRGEPVDRRWVPLAEISPALVRAVITSEDGAFCRHPGIDFGALREALRQSEDGDGLRGASTLTMQVAKNLFLWQGRSFVRKALEAPLALWIDLVWPKTRVIEVYLNIAEWGDGVFGVEAAARRHFNTSAARLTPQQAVLLATALPNPVRRDPGRPSTLQRRLAERLLARVQREGVGLGCLGR